MRRDGQREPDRLAEVMGAVSLATDMARGQALESAMGSTIIATRLARAMNLDSAVVLDTYYAAATRTLGCTSMCMEIAPLVLGDDPSFSYAMHVCDLADPEDVRAKLQAHLARSEDPAARARAIDGVLQHHAALPVMADPTAHQAVALSRRLPLPPDVPDLLEHVDARWDGKNPVRAGGTDIPIPMRIVELAVVVELFRRAGGPGAAEEVATSRAGSQFDPAVCATFRAHLGDIVEGFDAPSLWRLYLEAEPAPVRTLSDEERRRVIEVAADYADNKSGWFVGHSRLVGAVASAAAQRLDLPRADREAAGIAGLLHDLGRCGVANGIWDREGPLSDRERRVAESHSVHTETILTSCSALRPWARAASEAHERADGSGYHHHRVPYATVSELIGAADVYVALTGDRPWRDPYGESEAAEVLMQEVHSGRISARAASAVLEVCGQQKASATTPYPDGLTPREVEVLVLLARGLPTKQIADKLGIAYKTADNHIQKLYRKIGAGSRAAAAMYAVERGLCSGRA